MKLLISNIFDAIMMMDYPNYFKFTHIVSIGANDPIQLVPHNFDAHPATKLRLDFFDISEAQREDMNGPSEKDIKTLIEFYKEALKTGDPSFLIHCYAGKSRSVAAGIILLTMYYNDYELAVKEVMAMRPIGHANMRMIKLAGDYLGRKND